MPSTFRERKKHRKNSDSKLNDIRHENSFETLSLIAIIRYANIERHFIMFDLLCTIIAALPPLSVSSSLAIYEEMYFIYFIIEFHKHSPARFSSAVVGLASSDRIVFARRRGNIFMIIFPNKWMMMAKSLYR